MANPIMEDAIQQIERMTNALRQQNRVLEQDNSRSIKELAKEVGDIIMNDVVRFTKK